MKKQFLAKLLVLAMVLTLVPIAAFAAVDPGDDPYYYDRLHDAENSNNNNNNNNNDVDPPAPSEDIEPAAPAEEPVEVAVETTTNADGAVVATTEVAAEIVGSTATATVDAATVDALLEQAASSDIIVLSVAASSNATEAVVKVEASAIATLASKSTADLVVESSVANITISNADLAGLAAGAQDVEISAKVVGDVIQIVVAKDGKNANLANGITVELKAKEGTVVYIINEDGTETILEDVIFINGVLIVTLPGTVNIRLG